MVKQKKLISTGRGDFVDAVLQLLEEGVSLREMNLRQVARRIGCAHTNAYNYFASYEELLWWSLKAALERLAAASDPVHSDLIETYIDFALDHPAWYRLIWLDPLAGSPPEEVTAYLPEPSRFFLEWLASTLGSSPDDQQVVNGARILHGFIHGELSAISANRIDDSREHFKEQLLQNAGLLYSLLFERPYPNGARI